MTYAEAVTALFRAPLDTFVAERKRLAGELKAGGDPAGATRLAKVARPPVSAWTVDQLWCHAREAFDALFDAAARVRQGDLDGARAHREALASLRQRASALLAEAGHGATEATLRRVTQTLSALAATGSWDPDPPGALGADREPPGFEAAAVVDVTTGPRAEAAAAERQRLEEERAKAAMERRRLEDELRAARETVAQRQRDVANLEKELASARRALEEAVSAARALEARLGV